MKSSEQINELAAALSKAQSDMGGAVKDSANPFFKSNYADLTSVIKAIKQPFSGAQINVINDLIADTGTDSVKFCKAFKIAFVNDLLTLQYDRAVAALEAKK